LIAVITHDVCILDVTVVDIAFWEEDEGGSIDESLLPAGNDE